MCLATPHHAEVERWQPSLYETSAFMLSMIGVLAHDTCAPAIEALRELIAQPADSYSLDLLHMEAEQRQKRIEERAETCNQKR